MKSKLRAKTRLFDKKEELIHPFPPHPSEVREAAYTEEDPPRALGSAAVMAQQVVLRNTHSSVTGGGDDAGGKEAAHRRHSKAGLRRLRRQQHDAAADAVHGLVCSGCHDDAEPDAAGRDAGAEPGIASSG